MPSTTGTWRGAVAVAAAAGLLAACDVNIGLEATGVTSSQRKQFTVAGIPDVTLKTFDGAIEVRAWDRAEVVVDVETRASDKSVLDEIQVAAEQSGNSITVEARAPKGERNVVNIGVHVSPSARFIASVPREANVKITSGDGSLRIERVAGRVEMETGDGSIRGTDLSGEVRVHTSDGSVTLDGVNGRAAVETGDGGVKLSGRLESLKLRTGDGSVWVKADEGSRVADDWEIRTGDGGVSVEVPATFDADLDAEASSGHVRLDRLTLEGAVRSSDRAAKGRIGAGGRPLVVHTGDGTITIRRAGTGG
jgi:hypothetical protein